MILESKFYSDQFKNYFDQSYKLAEKKNKHFTGGETQRRQCGRAKRSGNIANQKY